jgi:hypothetical protein
MTINLIDLAEAGERLDAGEQAYEYQTDNKALRLLGPACGFGADYLRRLRGRDFMRKLSMKRSRMPRPKTPL